MTTDNFCFYFQNILIQTSQTGGQWYSDTSSFSIPWPRLITLAGDERPSLFRLDIDDEEGKGFNGVDQRFPRSTNHKWLNGLIKRLT